MSKKLLTERLAIYPDYAVNGEKWLDETIRLQVLRLSDSEGLARINSWSPGMGIILPEITKYRSIITKSGINKEIEKLLTRSKINPEWSENDIERLLCARGADFEAVCVAADDLRKKSEWRRRNLCH